MLCLRLSAMKRLPLGSTVTPKGVPILFSTAETSLNGGKAPRDSPFPAYVVMFPLGSTRRTRAFWLSAMKRLPEPSTATPVGVLKLALVAGPPSPLKPLTPFPATVVMTPVSAATRLMRPLAQSAMSTLPPPSTATPRGYDKLALVAGSLSPLKPPYGPPKPFPATVVMTPVAIVRVRIR